MRLRTVNRSLNEGYSYMIVIILQQLKDLYVHARYKLKTRFTMLLFCFILCMSLRKESTIVISAILIANVDKTA